MTEISDFEKTIQDATRETVERLVDTTRTTGYINPTGYDPGTAIRPTQSTTTVRSTLEQGVLMTMSATVNTRIVPFGRAIVQTGQPLPEAPVEHRPESQYIRYGFPEHTLPEAPIEVSIPSAAHFVPITERL